jgi:hypothetical protein
MKEKQFVVIVVPDGYYLYIIEESGVLLPRTAAVSRTLSMQMRNGALFIEAHNVSFALILNEYMKKAFPGEEHNFQVLDPMYLL